jgi:hypothetical protein
MTDAVASGEGLRAAKITGLFCALAAALYAISDAEPSPVVLLFFSAAPLFAVILWLERDAHRTGVGAVHDLGFLLWFGWLVVIPWYSWKTRGPRGWRLCLGLFGLIGSAYIAATLVHLIRHYAWYFRSGTA